MKFTYTPQELTCQYPMDGTCYLLTNGLGGYSTMSASFAAFRCDAGLLIGAQTAPNVRNTLIHSLEESFFVSEKAYCLDGQGYADNRNNGWKYLTEFSVDSLPVWHYQLPDVQVRRTVLMVHEENTAGLYYHIDNRGTQDCTLVVTPMMKPCPKDRCLEKSAQIKLKRDHIQAEGLKIYWKTDGQLLSREEEWKLLSYPEDAKDGRPGQGLAGSCCCVKWHIPAKSTRDFYLLFSDSPLIHDPWILEDQEKQRLFSLEKASGFHSPIGKALAVSSDCYISRRASTGNKTILAGYPLFSDWGRDTMIALSGCCLSTGRYEDAKSILRSFLQYEKRGLLPNLFPEGSQKPVDNSVDTPLLFIDCLWQYYQRTSDLAFIEECMPVAESILSHFQAGTSHGIHMDADGLILAGEGLDQLTWMDVCVDGILPTPRHGKPVEINAYWYNALMIMDKFTRLLGKADAGYLPLARKVKRSFISQFYMEEKGYLKDVISGTNADEQIRCNQIWAVSMSFSMLDLAQQQQVVDAVFRHLYTPQGLRSLSPADPEFRGQYGGSQFQRDMAYHQGTVWVFPLGAWYRSYLTVNQNSPEALRQVRAWLEPMDAQLKEGCAGHLPEIYDGMNPKWSKGCFAQAWSVGEILRVYEQLERAL